METECNRGNLELKGRKKGELLCSGYRASVWDSENFLQMDSGVGYTI